MINHSLAEYAFIRSCIFSLRAVTPISVTAIACQAIVYLVRGRWEPPTALIILDVWFAAETIFFLAVQLPVLVSMQRPADHPPLLPESERRALFERFAKLVSDEDAERHLRRWFRGAPLSKVGRDGVKSWLAWAFFDGRVDGVDAELEEYITRVEELVGHNFPHGYGTARPIRLTLDPVNVSYRSLAWYGAVGFVDFLTYTRLCFLGFRQHRQPLKDLFALFPFRPVALTARNCSPARHLSYWLRPHTSKTRRPILFIHGIGIGLYPYTSFLRDLNKHTPSDALDDDGGQVGILALELMPVSFRLTHSALSRSAMCQEILLILQHHGYDKFVLVAHSYGTVIATHMLRDPNLSPKISSLVLIDPVCFLLHSPDVAFNFTVRQPRFANEWQLWYFASQDFGVAHTLGRRFFWSENVLWKEEVLKSGLRVTVSLAGRDLIVDTETVGTYLAGSVEVEEDWKEREWDGEGLDVLWNEDKDHAQIFDKGWMRDRLVRVVQTYAEA